MNYNPGKTCQIKTINDLYLKYFGYKKDGYFIEIGAYDGELASNTSFLADIGWFGHYIEPIPEFMEKCKKRHCKNNIKFHLVAIGDENKKNRISVAGAISSISEESIELFSKTDWAKGYHCNNWIEIQEITADEFMENNSVPSKYDLLIVDAEGYESNILRKYDIQKWSPKIVIIELHEELKNFPRKDVNECLDYFNKNNYSSIWKDTINSIFVRNDHS